MHGIEDPTTVFDCGLARITFTGEGTDHVGSIVAVFKIYPRELETMGVPGRERRDAIIDLLQSGEAEVKVELTGTPQVAIQVAGIPDEVIPIPHALRVLSETVWDRVLEPLDWYIEAIEAGTEYERVS